MITTTLGALATTTAGINAAMALVLPVKTSYHIATLARKVRPEIETFNTQREALVRKHGTERPSTPEERATMGDSVFLVLPDKVKAFTAEFAELSAIPVTIAWAPLTLEMFEGQQLSGEAIDSLGPLLAAPAAAAAPTRRTTRRR